MKTLYIGDPHIKINNLEDSRRLFNYIVKIGSQSYIDQIVILGDVMDSHQIVRQEITAFWQEFLLKLNELKKPIIILCGNHDFTHVKEHEGQIYSLMLFNTKDTWITIVNDHFVSGRYIYHAYTHDSEKLIRNCQSATGADILIAHGNFTQELFGDMVNPELIPQKTIISGHVHSHHLSAGKVFYAGSPMWMTSTDAGEDKGIWVIESDNIATKTFISTAKIVTPMYRITIKEGDDIPTLPDNAKIAFELIGQSSWIATTKKLLKGKGSIKAVPLDRKHIKIDSSKLLNIDEYALNNFIPLTGVSVTDITDYIRGLNG